MVTTPEVAEIPHGMEIRKKKKKQSKTDSVESEPNAGELFANDAIKKVGKTKGPGAACTAHGDDQMQEHQPAKKKKQIALAIVEEPVINDVVKKVKKTKSSDAVGTVHGDDQLQEHQLPKKKKRRDQANVEEPMVNDDVKKIRKTSGSDAACTIHLDDQTQEHQPTKKKKKRDQAIAEEPVVTDDVKNIRKTKISDAAGTIHGDDQMQEHQLTKKKKRRDQATVECNVLETLKKDSQAEAVARNGKKSIQAGHDWRLIIKYIPLSIDEDTLRRDFEECGYVTNLKLMLDADGQSRGMAFVTYADEVGYSAALKYDNTDYAGKRLMIKPAVAKGTDVPESKKDPSKAEAKSKDAHEVRHDLRLMIKCIPRSIHEDTLRKDFEECGTVTNLKLLLDADGQSRGMAFVTYADEAGYFAALDYDGTEYGEKRLVIQRAESTGGKGPTLGPKPPGCNSIVLKRLAPEVNSDDIYSLFKDCGNGPAKVGLLTDRAGVSRCTARVDFHNEGDLDAATKFVGSVLKGSALVMDYCRPKTW